MFASLVAALLSDSCHQSRRNIVIFSATIAQLSCLVVWFLPFGPKSYNKLLFFQGVCGAAVGAASAVSTAMMADTCENSLLAISASSAGVIAALGVAAGQAIAGYNGPTKGWRYPFLVFGLVGLFLIVLSLAFFNYNKNKNNHHEDEEELVNQGNRDDNEKMVNASPFKKRSSSSVDSFQRSSCCSLLCCTPTLMLLFTAKVIVGLPNGVLDTYWTDYCALLFFTERTAKTDWRFDAKWDVAVALATDISVGIQIGRATGQVIGGVVGVSVSTKLPLVTTDESEATQKQEGPVEPSQQNPSEIGFAVLWVSTLMVIATFITPIPFLYTMLYAPVGKKNYWTQYWLANFLGGLFSGFNEPLSKAMFLGLAPSGLTGAVASIITMSTLLGKALGPTVVAFIASSHGRLVAFFDSFTAWFVVGFLLLGLCCSSVRDFRDVVATEQATRAKTATAPETQSTKAGFRAAAAATRAAEKKARYERMTEARKAERAKRLGQDGRGEFQAVSPGDADV